MVCTAKANAGSHLPFFFGGEEKFLFVGMLHRAYMELQVLRDGVAIFFSFFFSWFGGGRVGFGEVHRA